MFAPLHVISCYSLLKSGLTISKIVGSIKKNNYFACGISDNNLSYVPEFVKEMEKENRKLLLGLSVNIEGFNVSIYATSEEGYLKLVEITSLQSKSDYDFSSLKNKHNGLIGIIDTSIGYFKENFNNADFPKQLIKINDLYDKCYLGLNITSKEDINYAKKIREFVKEYPYETIAFPTIRYEKKDDAIVIKILDAIENDQTLQEKKLEGQEYFYKFEDYQKLYTKEELDRTGEIINSSTYDYHKQRGHILKYPVDDSITYLKELTYQGLKEKGLDDNSHKARLEMELEIIISMGYADYFLITQDYVNWAKDHDILVGPGRGSAAASLVSYCLNITEVDALKYNLPFERFLNKARKSMPDIDVDFMDTKRDLVIDYVRNKYGNEKVANIITFQTMGAKQSLRDIGRLYNIPNNHISLLCKLVQDKMDLRETYKKVPSFKSLVDSDKYFLEIVTLASKIEGLPRQTSLHASGVILSDEPLINGLPVNYDLEDHLVDQFEFNYLEEQGFLKMDFLGIRNLTTIDYCCDLVNKNPKNKPVDKKNIPYEDPNIFKLISSGMTMGLFQLESSGMNRAIKDLKPECFEDVVALLALFRPGPMDDIPSYIARKEGKEKVTYVGEGVKEVLSSTNGIIVYQEQINQLAIKMAGMSPTDADLFRAAVSKKKADVLASLKESFIKGSIANGYKEKDAIEYFNKIYKFANYGLNKSHAVVYAITACRMAYLKYYYPLEFYVAILATASSTSDSKFSDYVAEIRRRKLNVYKPDINKSTTEFEIIEDGLLFPLSGISGINIQFAKNIVEERNQNGIYKDYFDFVVRMHPYRISREQINNLIDGGAFDNFYPSRASLRETALSALQFAELNYSKNGQMSLDSSLVDKPIIFEVMDDPIDNLEKEYEALGIMLSDNPLRYKKDLLLKYHVVDLLSIRERKDHVNIAGIIRNKKVITVRKNNKNMAFITVFDEVSEIEVVIFSDLYEKCLTLLEKNNIVLVSGRYEEKEGKPSFIADRLNLLEGEENE